MEWNPDPSGFQKTENAHYLRISAHIWFLMVIVVLPAAWPDTNS